MPGRRFWLVVAPVIGALLALAPSGAAADSPPVLRASLDGEIDSATAAYVAGAVQQAQSEHAAALLVVMNTPGGISTSMDDMVGSLLGSRVPVVVYVSPAGARADSAGLFVAQAADVVAMAPGTNMGSAHPIDASGANLGSDLRDKVTNDAVARIRDLAGSHGRNADWCEQAVRKSVNVSAEEAVRLHVADLVAKDVPSLLAVLEGTSLRRPHATPVTLHLAGARVQDDPMPWPLQLLQLVTDPNVAYLLLLVAVIGLIAEATTPGAVLPGVIGGLSAVLALLGFASIPINVGGALLVVFAFVLFLVDLKAPTHGVLTVGGLVSLVLGSAFLVQTGPLGEGVSLWLIGAAALACAGLFGFVLSKAVRARSRPIYDVVVTAEPPAGREEAR